MRLAALYDIHGNLPALEAVLHEVRHMAPDRVVVGGDVFPGPLAPEALLRLLDLEVPVTFIRGNGESAVLASRAGRDIGHLPEQGREAVRWSARRLAPEQEKLIASWPATFRLEVPGLGEVLFCHATPRDETEIFTRTTPAERLRPIFEAPGVPLVVCGHTHMQFDRVVGATRIVNAGSVGMPFGPSGADWLLLGPDVELRHTAYDLAAAAERIRGTDYPGADDFADRYVLHPPSEEEMLDLYSRAGIE